MLKLLKNLKESWIQVVCIILLLCVQAVVDLKLPSFTSDIVNVGIQQNGIEDAVPGVIRAKTLQQLLMFTDGYEQILNDYVITEKNNENIKKYPAIESEELYNLKDISKEERESLNKILSKPLMVINLLSSQQVNSEMQQQMGALDEQAIRTIIDEKTKGMSDSIIEQGAIATVKKNMKR